MAPTKKTVSSDDMSAFGNRAEALRDALDLILLANGKVEPGEGLRFEDAEIELVQHGQSGGLELTRKINKNPVAIYARTGTCIRIHGEMRYVLGHVLHLARGALGKMLSPKYF
jgi:hypothetical protein